MNETVSRPKKLYRETAERERASPGRIATSVARNAACTESQSACRTASSSYATRNHFVLQSLIGQPCVTSR